VKCAPEVAAHVSEREREILVGVLCVCGGGGVNLIFKRLLHLFLEIKVFRRLDIQSLRHFARLIKDECSES
jgi:hypothetical protein